MRTSRIRFFDYHLSFWLTAALMNIALFSLPRNVNAASQRSIHQQESERHRFEVTHQKSVQNQTDQEILPLNSNIKPAVQTIVLGFHPHWMKDEFYNYRYDLLTTLAYFSIEINGRGDIIEKNGWPNIELINMAHKNGVKIALVVSNFDSSDLHILLSSSLHQERAINNILEILKEGKADGVNIDFENLDSADRDNLTIFMNKLVEKIHNNIPDSSITIDLPAVNWSESYDAESLASSTDGVMIMGYDYHYKKSQQAGPIAPIQSGEIWEPYNLTSSINQYLAEIKNQSPKMILGVPYYGYDWPTDDHMIPSKTRGVGKAKTYSEIRQEVFLRQWDESSQTPYYTYGQYHQVWYEDEQSLIKKYNIVKQNQLGGIGIWALGYDDGYNELWNTLNSSFGGEPENGTILVAPASKGSPQVKMFTEQGKLVTSFYAYHPNIRGGYNVIADDLNGDEKKEFIVVTGEGLGPHLRIFNTQGKPIAEEFVYQKNFRGGLELATGDINGDALPEIIIGPKTNGGPNIRIYQFTNDNQPLKLLDWFWGFEEKKTVGAKITLSDLNSDGSDEIIITPSAGNQSDVHVFSFDPLTQKMKLVANFQPTNNAANGISTAVGNIDSDEYKDIVIFPKNGGNGFIDIVEWMQNEPVPLISFQPYGKFFNGSMNLILGHFRNPQTHDLIIAPETKGGPNIRTYGFNPENGQMELSNWFFSFQPTFRGGVNIWTYDRESDEFDQLILAPQNQGGPNIRQYSFGRTLQKFVLQNWFWGYSPTFIGGIQFGNIQP